MESHPSYPKLCSLFTKYPRASGSLFQTYNDIIYAQEWTDVQVLEIPQCKRGALSGRKLNTEKTLYVVPCAITENLSFAWLQEAFASICSPPPQEIYLAITSEDASVVYYKLSDGIVKPSV